jgi:putative ABC transport system permease protein
MIRFVINELRHRRSRSLSLAAGILVAAVSFTLLTAAVSTGELRIKGTLAHSFEGPYDILVRPADSFAPLEDERGLVAANFASGIFGGITLDQWRQILGLPGVEVAAPIANIGYIAPSVTVRFSVNRFLNRDPVQLYRLRLTWSSDRGLSSFPGQDEFVYYTRVNRIVTPGFEHYEVLPNGQRLGVCYGFNLGKPPQQGPFYYSTKAGYSIECFSERSPRAGSANATPFAAGKVGAATGVLFPIMVAAIDPEQENLLIGLDDTITSGRSLRLSDTANIRNGSTVVPVIASDRNYVDEPLSVTVERLQIPPGVDVPHTLAIPKAFPFLTGLPGETLGYLHMSSAELYERELEGLKPGFPANYWHVSPARYRQPGEDVLSPSPVTNPADVYYIPANGDVAAPGNQDVQFRRLTNFPHSDYGRWLNLDILGRFDPALLPGFGDLSKLPLGAYAPPVLKPSDAESSLALGGEPLLPTMNLGGYIQQPPFLLTTLNGLKPFTDPSNFGGANPDAPISVIRVRVAGVTGPDDLSLARIRSVAQLIRQRTGLAVDIVAGSSPSPITIDLPAGDYGRPPLVLREDWVKKGVAVTIINALDRKSLFLFVLILLVTGFFLANGALASVRARRTEIATLACVGWSQAQIFRVVLAELALVGLVAGAAGSALALALIPVLSLHASAARALLVTPVAVLLACVAGLVPAWRASRMTPIEGIAPPVSRRSSSRSVKRIAGMAFVNLRRLPGRTIVAASGLFVGVAALTVLLAINLAFRGALIGSLLGNVVSVQVRGVDLLSVGLALVLAGLSVADVLLLNVRERAGEYVTLRSSGWRDGQLAMVVGLEGLGLGLAGALPGAAAGIAIAVATGGGSQRVVLAGALAVLVATAVALVASLVPAFVVSRMSFKTVLAEE